MNVYLPNLRLPSEYQEVEYIGRNGNNYIDTGWVPKLTAPFEVKVGCKISTSGVRYGVLSNYNGTSGEAGLTSLEINDGSHTNNVLRFYSERTSGSNSANIYSSNTLNLSSFNDIVYTNNGSSSGSVTLNGITTNGSVKTDGYSNLTAYLFIDRALRWSTYSNNSFISYCKIYENGTLVRDFVPCYRKSDSVIGLYDLVNNQFYTNSGTGTFSKGNDVTMAVLQNAYIGEVYEYSYDFRGKSTTILTNDGWTNAGSTPSFNSYGMTGSIIRYTKPISLSNAKKLTLSYTGTGGSDDEYGFRVGQTVTSSTRSGLTGTLYSLNNIYMNIYGSSQSYSGVSSGYHKVDCIMDFTAKTFQIKLDGASFQNGTLTDTQISNIKNNTTVTFAYVSGFGSDYGLESIYILIEK